MLTLLSVLSNDNYLCMISVLYNDTYVHNEYGRLITRYHKYARLGEISVRGIVF